jgi:integrase
LPSGNVIYRAIWKEPGPGGKPCSKSKNFERFSDAKAFAACMAQEVERRGVGNSEKFTLESYFKYWIDTLERRGEHSPKTIEGYRWQSAIATRNIGHMPLERVSTEALDQLYAKLLRDGGMPRKPNGDNRPLAARSVLNVHRVLHNGLDQARKWKLISENPAKDAKAPSPRKSRVKSFGREQVDRLLATAERDPETYVITALFLACGLRRSELLGLAWDAVNLDAATLEVRRTVIEINHGPVMREATKTDDSFRTIAIPPTLVTLLRDQKARVQAAALKWGKGYQREPMLAFPGLAGAPMVPSSLTTRMRQVMRRADVAGLSPCHAWRHTCATSLIHHAKENLKTVQARMGHSTPAITMALYVHPETEQDRAAANHFEDMIRR